MYHLSGLGFRHEKGKKFYGAFGGEFASADKTNKTSTTQTDYSTNKQELYGVAGIRLVNKPAFKVNLGLRGMYRCQEDIIETANASGNSVFKDTTSIPGLGVEGSIEVGNFVARIEYAKYFGGVNTHEGEEAIKVTAGGKF